MLPAYSLIFFGNKIKISYSHLVRFRSTNPLGSAMTATILEGTYSSRTKVLWHPAFGYIFFGNGAFLYGSAVLSFTIEKIGYPVFFRMF